MPIFDFKCPKCENYEELFVKDPFEGWLVPKCDAHMVNMEKVITAPRKSGIQFTGVKGSSSMRTKP